MRGEGTQKRWRARDDSARLEREAEREKRRRVDEKRTAESDAAR